MKKYIALTFLAAFGLTSCIEEEQKEALSEGLEKAKEVAKEVA